MSVYRNIGPLVCIWENKDADQLLGNRESDQRICIRYTDSTIPLLLKSEISSPLPSSVIVQPGLCQTWSETQKTGFLTTRLIFSGHSLYEISLCRVRLNLYEMTTSAIFCLLSDSFILDF